MFPAQIAHYARPATIADALAEMKAYPDGDGIFIAGGQSLMQAIKSRMVRPTALIDLQDIGELKGITIGAQLSIKPMTRYVEIATHGELPNSVLALQDAAGRVGDRQVRNRGTIGGSLCWNYIASCMPAVALALQASLSLASPTGKNRTVSADDFLLGPLETDKADDEMLTDICFENTPNTGSAYQKWGLVTDSLPVVGVCARLKRDGDFCAGARLAFSGLANGATRSTEAEALLTGQKWHAETINSALQAAVENLETQGDQWASANYRQHLIQTIGEQVLNQAWQRAV